MCDMYSFNYDKKNYEFTLYLLINMLDVTKFLVDGIIEKY